MKNKNKTMLFDILAIALISYLAFGVLLFLRQKNYIYYPTDQDFFACPGFTNYEKTKQNGTRFYFLDNTNKSDEIIVFYHGNAGSACDRSFFRSTFESTGQSIIFVEYAGYSSDNKKPSQKLILQDVKNIQDFITDKKFSKVTLLGESIGTGAAAYHSTIGKADKILLLSTFSSTADIGQSIYPIYPVRWFLTEKYNNTKWLKNYTGKIIIIHGEKDKIIPARFSKKLFDNLKTDQRQYHIIKDASHNDIYNYSELYNKINKFLLTQ